MNLKHLTDAVLLAETESAANREREALSAVLHHLREVDLRRLYSALKYQSLSEYMIKHLKYTEDQAWPRISAMRLLKEIPAIEKKINDGSLSLSNLNLARRAFVQEEIRAKKTEQTLSRTVEQKMAVLEKLENVSKREAEKIVRAETGVILKSRESTRELSDGTIEVAMIVSKEDLALLEKLKGRLAHSHPGMTNSDLLRQALAALDRASDPTLKATRAASRPVPEQSAEQATLAIGNSRYIPSTVRHHVWLRDGGACTNCGSMHAVQFEHIIPIALGGTGAIENIKLLCRSCNQRSAIETYGAAKMSKYLKSPMMNYDLRSEDRSG